MPLFMDFHDLDEFTDDTIDKIKQGHKLDLVVQKKYNVQYKHYYLSKENRKAFCVIEGPDKESCEAVHREAHGVTACNIIEVEQSRYGVMMGLLQSDPDGMHLNLDGSMDSGLRTLLLIDTVVSIRGNNDVSHASGNFGSYLAQLKEILGRYAGREISMGRNEISYAFTSCGKAVECSLVLRKEISRINKTIDSNNLRFEATIVLTAGEPVTMNSEFFGDTIRLARRLSHTGRDGQIIMSSSVNERSDLLSTNGQTEISMRITSVEDERFIDRTVGILENRINDEKFSVLELGDQIGISRPHLYRRVNNLFGRSPNNLIGEMRLREANKLICKGFGNIAEIAYEVGFSNPSYFAKCFQKRFGVLPSLYHVRNLT